MYKTFVRNWYRANKAWPRGREPHAGRKTWHDTYETEEQARAACREWNSTHDAGHLSRKMEYTSDY